MEYKILLVKNRYTKNPDFTKGLEWFKKHTPLEIVTESISTDFDVTTKNVGNATFTGVVCGDDIYEKLKTVVPEGKYHAVVLLYGNDLNGIRVSITNSIPLYQGTDFLQICTDKDGGKTLNHELFHSFFYRLKRQQIVIEDPMDIVIVDGVWKKYFNNDDLDAVLSNRSIALERLNPYWDKVVSMLSVNNKSMSTYKYFKDSEVVGLKPELVKMLDKAREIAGIPFVITSGYRTLEKNDEVGGVEHSSHTLGEAVDLRARNSNEHFKITKALILAGFNRISKKYPAHIHCDISKDKPQDVLF